MSEMELLEAGIVRLVRAMKELWFWIRTLPASAAAAAISVGGMSRRTKD